MARSHFPPFPTTVCARHGISRSTADACCEIPPARLLATLSMVGVAACSLGGGLGHILAFDRLPIPLITLAVVDLRSRIHPDLAWTSARCRCFSGPRRGCRTCRRCNFRRIFYRGRGSSLFGGSAIRIPFLYAPMTRARTFFRSCFRIGTVLAHAGGTCWGLSGSRRRESDGEEKR